MASPAINYSALANQVRSAGPKVDYAALATQARGGSAQPSPAVGSTFWNDIGGPAVVNFVKAIGGDHDAASKTLDSVKSTINGLAGEPARVWSELSESGKALVAGHLADATYHLAGAVPIVGGAAQQVAQSADKGNYEQAAEHAAALMLPFMLGGKGNVGAALDAAEDVGTKAAAAAPKMAVGLSKVGAGAVLDLIPLPISGRGYASYRLMRSGAADIGKGLKAGAAAETAAPVIPELSPEESMILNAQRNVAEAPPPGTPFAPHPPGYMRYDPNAPTPPSRTAGDMLRAEMAQQPQSVASSSEIPVQPAAVPPTGGGVPVPLRPPLRAPSPAQVQSAPLVHNLAGNPLTEAPTAAELSPVTAPGMMAGPMPAPGNMAPRTAGMIYEPEDYEPVAPGMPKPAAAVNSPHYSPEESRALAEYRSESNPVNESLRSAGSTPHPDVSHIDAAIQKNSLPQDTVLYRGFSKPTGYSEGETFTDKGFSSTTTDKDLAALEFGRRGDLAVIHVPAGTNAVKMGEISSPDVWAPPDQGEVLLPRGMKYTVIKKEFDPTLGPNGKTIIHMRADSPTRTATSTPQEMAAPFQSDAAKVAAFNARKDLAGAARHMANRANIVNDLSAKIKAGTLTTDELQHFNALDAVTRKAIAKRVNLSDLMKSSEED